MKDYKESDLLPCPFCAMRLINYCPPDANGGDGWAEHPKNEKCFFSLWEFDWFRPEEWNLRGGK